MASSRALIANGGHTTLSEAAWLRKPILSVPIRHQGEQELNAAWLARDGHGVCLRRPSPRSLARALDDAIARGPRPRRRAATDEAALAVHEAIEEVS